MAAVDDLLRRVEAIPNVESATISNLIPMQDGGAGSGVVIDGTPLDAGKEQFVHGLELPDTGPRRLGSN